MIYRKFSLYNSYIIGSTCWLLGMLVLLSLSLGSYFTLTPALADADTQDSTDTYLGTQDCVDFEDSPLGAIYNVGDNFIDSGVTILATTFIWSNGIPTNSGFAEVENGGLAGGTGQEVEVNNITLAFDFGQSLTGLSLRFGEYGGNLNVDINGDFRNFDNFADINGLTIGGVNVSVVNGLGNDIGILTLTGAVNSFAIGGQELWIDDVCPDSDCVNFEDPPLGTTYNVGDTFVDSGVTISATTFIWSNGIPTNSGFAEVENGGLAGGTGQEVEVNNITLAFFGSPLSGLSLRFGEYGGNLNVDINGDFRNFDNFADINGLTIGGVNVSGVNGFGNDMGTLTLTGLINSFAIGGQELWLDDVCPLAAERIFLPIIFK